MYAVYRMKKDGSEVNYVLCCDTSFVTYAEAIDAAQAIYESDTSYKVEVRTVSVHFT